MSQTCPQCKFEALGSTCDACGYEFPVDAAATSRERLRQALTVVAVVGAAAALIGAVVYMRHAARMDFLREAPIELAEVKSTLEKHEGPINQPGIALGLVERIEQQLKDYGERPGPELNRALFEVRAIAEFRTGHFELLERAEQLMPSHPDIIEARKRFEEAKSYEAERQRESAAEAVASAAAEKARARCKEVIRDGRPGLSECSRRACDRYARTGSRPNKRALNECLDNCAKQQGKEFASCYADLVRVANEIEEENAQFLREQGLE